MVSIIDNILKTINSKYKYIFYNKTANRKYDINILLTLVILIRDLGLSYSGMKQLCLAFGMLNENIVYPYSTTIYRFYNKLIKYNIITDTFNKIVNSYITKNKPTKFLVDSTLIPNKYGIDCTGYNAQFKKHKTTKISLITDIKGKPINIMLAPGNRHDAKIFMTQLDTINLKQPNNVFIGDKAYDSRYIRDKLNEKNLGILIIPRNRQNTKDSNKLDLYKTTDKEKKLLNLRHNIEFTNKKLKDFNKIYCRRDKTMIKYFNFVVLAAISIFLNY